MNRATIYFLVLSLIAVGCERGHIDSRNIVTKLRIMGMSGEPAAVVPGEDTAVKLLWADPGGEGRDVGFVWAAYARIEYDGYVYAQELLPPHVKHAAEGGDTLLIPGALTRGLGGYGEHSMIVVEVFMCAGDLSLSAEEIEQYASLLDACRGDDFFAVKMLGFMDDEYPESNPVIDRMQLDGETLTVKEEGGREYLTLGEGALDVRLETFFTPEQSEPYEVEVEEGVFEEQNEHLYVSWFATGGVLMRESSYPGYYENIWRLSRTGVYTLYAVAHDSRGGTSWKTYEVEVR